MKKVFFVLPFLLFLYVPLHSLNSEISREEIIQKELQHEVAVTLKLIQVYVTDKEGNPVTDLNKEDFFLFSHRPDFYTLFITLRDPNLNLEAVTSRTFRIR